MEVEKAREADVLELPTRPRCSSHSRQDRAQLSLSSNFFEIDIDKTQRIYFYTLEILSADGKNFRFNLGEIIEALRPNITKEIGIFLHTGYHMYAAERPKFEQTLTLNHSYLEQRKIEVKIALKNEFPLYDVFELKDQRSKYPLKFLNLMLKNYLRKLGYIEYGRTLSYYDPSRPEYFKKNIVIHHGFQVRFKTFEKQKLFLRIDVSHKILRTDTVLTLIDDIYDRPNSTKEEKRKTVASLLVGKYVLARYGNYRYWRIDDVLFDKDCNTICLDDKKTTLTEYYKIKYNYEIKVVKQPLLVHRNRFASAKKQDSEIFLIPEFCILTGLPNEDSNIRRELANTCSLGPEDRMRKVNKMLENIKKNLGMQNQSSKFLTRDLGLSLSSEQERISGEQLAPPQIFFDGGRATSPTSSASFKINCPIIKSIKNPIRWAVLHFKLCSASAIEIIDCLNWSAKEVNIKVESAIVFDLGEIEGKKSLAKIYKYLKNNANFLDIVVILLPNNMKGYYSEIKQIGCLEVGVLTQIILTQSLVKKGPKNLSSKVFLQMCAKLGSMLWLTEMPKELPQHLMFIAINSQNEKSKSAKTTIGICSTIDRNYGKYFNKIKFEKYCEVLDNPGDLVAECILEYEKFNKRKPGSIVLFRDGVGGKYDKFLRESETEHILSTCAKLEQNYLPLLTYIRLERKTDHKFFSQNIERRLFNPPSGTLVNNTLVTEDYEFYMVSQNVTRGTATPTYYRVIYDSLKLPEKVLHEAIYRLCFSYANWTGAIRVPAPSQYAHKLCTFVSHHLKEAPDERLSHFPYFL